MQFNFNYNNNNNIYLNAVYAQTRNDLFKYCNVATLITSDNNFNIEAGYKKNSFNTGINYNKKNGGNIHANYSTGSGTFSLSGNETLNNLGFNYFIDTNYGNFELSTNGKDHSINYYNKCFSAKYSSDNGIKINIKEPKIRNVKVKTKDALKHVLYENYEERLETGVNCEIYNPLINGAIKGLIKKIFTSEDGGITGGFFQKYDNSKTIGIYGKTGYNDIGFTVQYSKISNLNIDSMQQDSNNKIIFVFNKQYRRCSLSATLDTQKSINAEIKCNF